MTTGLIFDERFYEHETGPHHPERPQRLITIGERLHTSGLIERLTPISFEPASPDWVRRVHDQAYVDRLRAACDDGISCIDVPDSGICTRSFDVALLAVGGALAASDAVMVGRVDNAFCAVRPPGHHAEPDRSMGFCLFNNIAIAAEYLIARYGLERIAIVDFDVHHGNGTQHIFERRSDILFISLHEHPRFLYPGTGFEHETGIGPGKGLTLNLPMMPHSGDGQYRKAFVDFVLPALHRYEPQALLVSAGFDASATDPLAHVELTATCFSWMTIQLKAAAESLCAGRLICLLEGGYDLDGLSDCVEAHVRALVQPAPTQE